MLEISPANLADIIELREEYVRQMNCQIVHDSIHRRSGWTREYALRLSGQAVGYGSIAVAGPWHDKPTAYEFYLRPEYQLNLLSWMRAFLERSQCTHIEVQSNDRLASLLLATFADSIQSEAILFQDLHTTHLNVERAVFREPTIDEEPELDSTERSWRAVVEFENRIVASGGVLFHYNPPYGDIYMEVNSEFRRRGFGAYIVQELKALCHRQGKLPVCRCNVTNLASQYTLQRAGFVPCGNIMLGKLIKAI